MSTYGDIFRRLLFRLLLASPFILIAGIVLIKGGYPGPGLFYALPFAAVTAFIMAGPIIELVGQPLVSIIYPSQHLDHTLPMYGVPQSRRARGLYEEAMVEYERIALKYPEEVQPYIGMVEVAALDLRDPARAEAIFRKGMAVLQKETDRAVLEQMYESISSRLHPKPDWLLEDQARVLQPEKIDPSAIGREPDGQTVKRYHAGGHYGPGYSPDQPPFIDPRPKVKYRKGEDGSVHR